MGKRCTPSDAHNLWSRMFKNEKKLDAILGSNVEAKSNYMVDVAKNIVGLNTDAKIIEVGCNAGRTLNKFYQAGFRNLHGLDISYEAIKKMEKTFPDVRRSTTIHLGLAESVMDSLRDEYFDLCYSIAVLMHIHPDSIGGVCANMARVSRAIIIFESEYVESVDYNWARDYEEIFCNFGMKQVKKLDDELIHKLLGKTKYAGRVFKRE
jgi:SAM-dependent methyltransferase